MEKNICVRSIGGWDEQTQKVQDTRIQYRLVDDGRRLVGIGIRYSGSLAGQGGLTGSLFKRSGPCRFWFLGAEKGFNPLFCF